MAQLNLHLTAEFDRALRTLMKRRGIATKSEAVRLAVIEAAQRSVPLETRDFAALRGAGLRAPQRALRRFHTHQDLWE